MMIEKIQIHTAPKRRPDIKDWITQVLCAVETKHPLVKINLFFAAKDQEDFFHFRELVDEVGHMLWPDHTPVFNCIGQAPVDADLVLELVTIEGEDVELKSYSNTPLYAITVTQGEQTQLYTSYASTKIGCQMHTEPDKAMEALGVTLSELGFDRGHIKRQWNYIEAITSCSLDGQHYQSFNNSRSRFFESSDWPKGYPAATGIGSSFGGLLVDTLALKGGKNEMALDNRLQQAAHHYSKEVLVGRTQKKTPKFERAKFVCDSQNGMLYISGTAAIRGEESLADADVITQAQITLENIQVLHKHPKVQAVLQEYDLSGNCEVARVYLKDPDHWSLVQPLCAKFLGPKLIPLQADVCRSSLLIEIEVTYSFKTNQEHAKNLLSLTIADPDLCAPIY